MEHGLTFNKIFEHISSDEKEFIKLLEAVSDLSKFRDISEEEEERRISETKGFIEAAEYDLKSSKILYNSKIYPTAIYHLQQAVEKYVKAYMINFFVLNIKEIRDVGHDSPKAFLKLLNKFKNIFNLSISIAEKAYLFDSKIQKISMENIHNLENSIKNNKEQVAKMNSAEIENMISLAYNILESQKNQETMRAKLIESLGAFRKELEKEIEESGKEEKWLSEAIAVVDKMVTNSDNTFENYSKYSNISALYIISILTYPHASFARYSNKILPPHKYDETLGIVQCFSKIVELLEKILEPWKIQLLQEISIRTDS